MLNLIQKVLNKTPKASIILPTYNRKRFLKRSISSVLMQCYSNWELIIVDDGSTDGSFEYLNENYSHFHNIKIIKINNSGPAIAMNEGAKHASGQLLFFLGSDDELKTNHISFRIKIHGENPEVDVYHGGVKVIGDHWVSDKYNPNLKVNIYNCFAGGTFSVKRSVFQELRGFKNLKYASDADFIERAAKDRIIARIDLPTTYLYYRDHSNSITKNI